MATKTPRTESRESGRNKRVRSPEALPKDSLSLRAIAEIGKSSGDTTLTDMDDDADRRASIRKEKKKSHFLVRQAASSRLPSVKPVKIIPDALKLKTKTAPVTPANGQATGENEPTATSPNRQPR
jgi:hypothetical protein